MNGAYLVEHLLIIGLIVVITIVYFGLRKFIAWALQDENKWHKGRGHIGMSKDEIKNKKKLAYDKLTSGYLLFMGVLIFLLVVSIVK